jgi:hypothetical protein
MSSMGDPAGGTDIATAATWQASFGARRAA